METVESIYYKEYLVRIDVHKQDKNATDIRDALLAKDMKSSVQLLRYIKHTGGKEIKKE